jgi:O-antigen ligase
LIAINTSPVNESAVGVIIAGVVAMCSALSGTTWVYFMVASQISRDPTLSPISLGQMGVLAAVLMMPFTSVQARVFQAVSRVRSIVPFLLWLLLSKLMFHNLTQWEFYASIVVFILALAYMLGEHADVRCYVFAVLCGTALPSMLFIAKEIGLQIISKEYVSLSVNMEIARTGSGRGDVNTDAANLAIFIAATLSILVCEAAAIKSRALRRWLAIVLVTLCVVGLQALVSTYSRGGYYGLLLGMICFISMQIRAKWTLARRFVPAVLVLLGVCTVIGGVAYDRLNGAYNGVAATMNARNADDGLGAANGIGWLSGRSTVWLESLRVAAEYPFTGARYDSEYQSSEIASIAISRGELGIAAHNVFIELAERAGVPALGLFLYFLYGAYKSALRAMLVRWSPTIVVIIVCILAAFMTLSISSWKTFWCVMAIVYAPRVSADYWPGMRKVCPSRLFGH